MTRAFACSALLVLSACMKAPDPEAGIPQTRTQPQAGPPQVELAAPSDWQATQPTQSFFLKTWALPDGGIANISWLGPSTSMVAQNVDRWIGQFAVEGGDPFAAAQRDSDESGNFPTQFVQVTGTMTSVNQLGGGDPREGWMLFGAVVDTPSGPLYVKVLGPESQISAQAAELRTAILGLTVDS